MGCFNLGLGFRPRSTVNAAPVEIPDPLTISDFQNDAYSIGGVSKTFAEMWQEELSYGQFDESSLVAGVGITVTDDAQHTNVLSTTAEHWAAIAAIKQTGFSTLLDYSMAQAGTAKPEIMFEIWDIPTYSTAHGFQHEGTSVSNSQPTTPGEVKLYDSDIVAGQLVDKWPAPDPGDFRVALMFADDMLMFSMNGESVKTTSANPQNTPDANAAILQAFISHGTNGSGIMATSTLRSCRFYARLDANQLRALSL